MDTPRSEGQLLLTAGPCMEHSGRAAYSHTSKHFKGEILPGVAEHLRTLIGTEAKRVFTFDSGATFLQEAVLRQVARPGETIGVVVNGGFGLRWKQYAEALGLEVKSVEAPFATPVSADDLRAMLKREPEVKAVFWVSADTSVGFGNPSREFAEVVREERGEDGLAIVDCVLEIGGRPYDMDAFGVDVTVGSSGKCLGSVANLGFGAVNARAEKWMRNVGEDVASPTLGLVKWWNMMEQGQFHHTNGVQQVMSFYETLEQLLGGKDCGPRRGPTEGLTGEAAVRKIVSETQRLNQELLSGLEDLGIWEKGFGYLVEEQYAEHRLPQLVALTLPSELQGDTEGALRLRLEEEFGIFLGGGLGAYQGKIWRLGIMGGLNSADLEYVLSVLQRVL